MMIHVGFFKLLKFVFLLVQYCLQSLYVRNGRAVCDRVDRIHGTICNFYCDDGYELTADSVKMKKCAGTSFTDGKIECKSKYTCSWNEYKCPIL